MATAYQYDASGYFAGEIEDYGLLPSNATYIAPDIQEGCIACWTGKNWEQSENHKGENGYIDNKPHTITQYGAYPKGWSTTPPPKTEAELKEERRDAIFTRLAGIDEASIRPLRAVAQGEGTKTDKEKLADFDAEVQKLRKELSTL